MSCTQNTRVTSDIFTIFWIKCMSTLTNCSFRLAVKKHKLIVRYAQRSGGESLDPQTKTPPRLDVNRNKCTYTFLPNWKELHLRRAEAARLVNDSSSKIEDDTYISICFDLQKTLTIPNLTNQKAYYYRQLWTYNLAIHELKTGWGNIYMRHKSQSKP